MADFKHDPLTEKIIGRCFCFLGFHRLFFDFTDFFFGFDFND